MIDGKALYIEEMWEYIPGDHDVVSENLDKCMLAWLICKQVQQISLEDEEFQDILLNKLTEPEGCDDLWRLLEKVADQNIECP